MADALPVRLFLNHQVKSKIGEAGQFPWWLIHTGTETIGSVTVELHQSSPSDHIAFQSFLRNKFMLNPGRQLKCPTGFTVKHPGHQALEVRVTLQTVSGRRIALKSEQDLGFYFENSSVPSTIRIEGSAIVKKMPPGTVVEIQKNAIVNWQNDDDQADSASYIHQEELREEDVYEIQLCERMPDGLVPLDFVAFSAAWARHQRRSVAISFVDGSERRRGDVAQVGDAYRLQVKPYESGYLTLIARGTSGRYMIMSPNTQSTVHAVRGQQTYFFPGDLFPEQLDFCDPGVEFALALVTSEPLLATPSELINEEEGTVNSAHETSVYSLLDAARKRLETALGFTQLTVKD